MSRSGAEQAMEGATAPEVTTRWRGWAPPSLAVCFGGAGLALSYLVITQLRFFPLTLLLFLAIVPLMQFALAPVWRGTGAYRYYSPLFFVVERGQALELHGGTAYDYLLLRPPLRARGGGGRRVLVEYLAGLLALIRDIENGRIDAARPIVMTSYFFTERTAAELGFQLERPSPGERLHLLLDCASVIAMNSYARGRLRVPRFWKVRRAVTTAATLAERRPQVEALLARLSDRRSAAASA